MALVLDWQKKLGYKTDPFESYTPTPVSRFIIGMNDLQERTNLFLIKEERFGTVSGEKGAGKTMFLQWMNEQLAPQKSHVQHYIDAKECSKKEDIITALLKTRLGFFEKMSKSPLKASAQEQENILLQRLAKEQKNVLLIDNAGVLGKHELEFLAHVATRTPTHVIIADTEEKLKKISSPDLVDKLKLKIPEYTVEQLTLLLRKRIESVGSSGTFPFNDEEVKNLIKRADKNPTKLLQLARERAIELSLKVTQAPKAAPPPQTQGGFLSIKVQKKAEPPEPAVERQEISKDTAADAAALTEILNTVPKDHPSVMKTATLPPEEEKLPVKVEKHDSPHHKTKHDKMVEQLVEQMARPAHKKVAKKKR